MRIFKWTPDFHPPKESPLIPIWVHFHGLPLYMFEGERLLSVANSIGKPLRIDSHNVNRVKLGTASVCVERDVSKPLMNECGLFLSMTKILVLWMVFGKRWNMMRFSPIVRSVFMWARRTTIVNVILKRSRGLKLLIFKEEDNIEVKTVHLLGTKENDEVAHVPAVTRYIRRGNIIENWIKKLYTKTNVTKMPEKEVIPITNSFAGLESIDNEEKRDVGVLREEESEDFGESTHGPNLNGPEHSLHGSMVIVGKLNVSNLDGFQAISKDFQEDMGAFRNEFSVPSASSSPRSKLERENGALELLSDDVELEGQLSKELQQDIAACDESSAVVITEKAVSNIPERRDLWEALSNLQKFCTPWIVMGDYNALVSGDKRVGGNAPNPISMSDFPQCLQDCNLLEAGFVGSKFTWTNGKLSQRLDRVVCDQLCLDTFPVLNVRHVAETAFDHAPLLIELKFLHDTPKCSFRFQNTWLHHEDLKNVIIEYWSQPVYGDHFFILTSKLKGSKYRLRRRNKEVFGNIFTNVDSTEDRVLVCKSTFEGSGLDSD
ncbi:hypothetical protein LIER_25995 [Lithospermum erythrorhizon]|uniref:DUF4283 domain-containing protein n=1 Tax=Lithospermum erythrorhizon TaxID=34254 RepID=A0AAV3RAH0_LITER